MNDMNNLTPFETRAIVKRYWEGESLPRIADSIQIDRVDLFNFKLHNQRMWKTIENNISQSEIRRLIHIDTRAELSDRDTARVNLCFYLLKNLPQRGARAFPYRNFIVESLLRFTDIYNTTHQEVFASAEIHKTDDAKDAVATFENHTGITLLESPITPTQRMEKGAYHV